MDSVPLSVFPNFQKIPISPNKTLPTSLTSVPSPATPSASPSRYENQKRRDWNTFNQYLRNHRPPLSVSLCTSSQVLEFLRYLDQFGKTKVHNQTCPYFGLPNPPASCPCPLRQAWGSLDALIGRLRAAFEEHGGKPEVNPFGARAVRLYLREVRDFQSKSRGISYQKKRKRSKQMLPLPLSTAVDVDGYFDEAKGGCYSVSGEGSGSSAVFFYRERGGHLSDLFPFGL